MTSATCRPSSASCGRAQDGRRSRMIAEAGLAALWLAAALVAAPAHARRGSRCGRRCRRCCDRCGRSRSRRALLDAARLRCMLIWLFAAHRPVGRSWSPRTATRQAAHLQIRRRVGESRRLDAAVGDGAGGRRRVRSPCSSGGCGERTLDRDARRAGGDRRSASTPSCCSPRTRSRGSIPAPVEGKGLNPLLQDPGLAFHPPTLYLGYVGLSVAFSLRGRRAAHPRSRPGLRPGDAAVGARRLDLPDARHHRRQLLGLLRAWLGRLVVLGPGRECLADAVAGGDRACSIRSPCSPRATALRAWTMMLAVVAFSMSMVGTFLVRSGILTSVHAFAVDPERGTFILALLAIYVGGALALFALRVGDREGRRDRSSWSAAKARWWSTICCSASSSASSSSARSIRLFVEALSGEKLSVGAALFQRRRRAARAAPASLVMAIGPLLRWRRDELRALGGRLAIPALLGATALAIAILLAPGIGIAAAARPGPRARRRRRQPRAARRPQPAAHAARHLGHGRRPFRHRGRARRHGRRTAPSPARRWSPRDPGETRRASARGRSSFDGVTPTAGPELDRARGAS